MINNWIGGDVKYLTNSDLKKYFHKYYYFNRINFRKIKFREVKNSQNVAYKLSRIGDIPKFREINIREWRNYSKIFRFYL